MNTQNNLIEPKDSAVALPWRWRDKLGIFWSPEDMITRHLFNTVCMIWNHTMPGHMATHNYIRHSFDAAFYTGPYMKQGIRRMLPELLRRDDLDAGQRARLNRMRSWFHEQEGIEIKLLEPKRKPLA